MAKEGQAVKFSPNLDTTRPYHTDAMDAKSLAGLLKHIDEGDIAASIELQQEMEAKDLHLLGVCARRREALTALEWAIEPDVSDPNGESDAQEAAEYCDFELRDIETFPETLEHLSMAIGPGVSVVEKVIREGRLAWTADVPGNRLQGAISGAPDVYILTDESPQEGIYADPRKFVVYTPSIRSGFSTRVTLTRALGLIHLIKHYGIADWSAFLEKFGMPTRIGKHAKDADAATRQNLMDMLKYLGTDGHAMFPVGTEIDFMEAARGSEPFSGMIEWAEKKQSIGLLGQTLTTDIGAIGSRAAATVHENVKASILLSDIQQERRMIREGFLRQMVELRWPNKAMPVPHWVRDLVEPRNIDEERLDMERLNAANVHGLALDEDVKYELLGLPMPKERAPQLAPSEGPDDEGSDNGTTE